MVGKCWGKILELMKVGRISAKAEAGLRSMSGLFTVIVGGHR
jgi:hypothetical protein